MTLSVVKPSHLGALSAGNLYRGFTVGHCFFSDYLKMSSAKDVTTAPNKQTDESLLAETIPHGKLING